MSEASDSWNWFDRISATQERRSPLSHGTDPAATGPITLGPSNGTARAGSDVPGPEWPGGVEPVNAWTQPSWTQPSPSPPSVSPSPSTSPAAADQPRQDEEEQPFSFLDSGSPVAPAAPAAATGRGGLAKLAGKASWNLIDQMLSTLTNAVLTVLVAHRVSSSAFGAFSVATLLFSLLIAIERALAGAVLSIRHSRAGPQEWPRIASRALGTVATLAVPAGVLLAAIGLLLGGQLQWPLVAVGVSMPALLLQDTVRSIFFAQSRADLAAVNDGLWAVIQFTVMGILIVGGWATTGSLILAWGLSAGACVGVALVQLRAVPAPSATRGWVREHGDLLGYMLPETLVTSGGDKASYLLVGRILSVGAVGAVNAARQILNPLLVIAAASMSFAMPEISRRAQLSVRTRWLLAIGLAAFQAAASLSYVGLVLWLPGSIGHFLFGKSWAGAHSVLLPMGLFSTTAGICLGPFMVIASLGHANRTFRVTMLQTALGLILMPLGAVYGGVTGAAWGLFIGKVIEVPFWFLTLRTAARLGPAQAPDDHPDGEGPPLAEAAAPGPA